jgi:Ca2+-binding EF-hand superfamily protein
MNKEIYELFELFDTDNNKVINRKDFETGFKHLKTDLSEEEILTLLDSTGKE